MTHHRVPQLRARVLSWIIDRVKGRGACAAFCRPFQGDWAASGITFAVAVTTMWARHHGAAYASNRLVFTGASACVAGSIAGALQTVFDLSRSMETRMKTVTTTKLSKPASTQNVLVPTQFVRIPVDPVPREVR